MSDPLFPPGSPIRRVNGDPIVLLGGGRALLMQLAHPAVARGVAEHSDFERDPWTRLQRTLATMSAIVYGTVDEAERTAAALRAVHETVRGAGYHANDPELLLWVHATLVDTAVRMHGRFGSAVAPSALDELHEQSNRVAEILGVPPSLLPRRWEDFRAYVRSMVTDLAPQVGPEARAVASAVLHPRTSLLLDPLLAAARQLTTGLLPPPLRQAYGLGWDPGRGAALHAVALAARATVPLRRLGAATGLRASLPVLAG